MTKLNMLRAGFIATAMLMTPAMAQEATQEPGAMGHNYPDSNHLTGGYGSRATRPGYSYRSDRYGPAGEAAGVVRGAMGSAAALAGTPFDQRGPYARYNGREY